MIITDSHLHSSFSSDSKTPMEDMVKEGIRLGLRSMCMTDHHDIDIPVKEEGMDFILDVESYLDEYHRLKEKYKDQIELLAGVELGIQPTIKEKLNAFMDQYQNEFDFIIGSTHVVDKMDPYNPLYYSQFEKETDGIRRYFEVNVENLSTFDRINTYGHADYAVRYAPHKDEFYVPSEYFDVLDVFLKKLVEKGIALEFNTSGLKYGLKQANPHIDIIRRYKELGGELVTVGSDGHIPEHMAWEFKKGCELLKEAGFEYYAFFRKQKPEMIRL